MNILLIDDHALFRRGLKFLLDDLDEAITFLEAPSIPEINAHKGADIDLILLDLNLPGAQGMGGLLLVKELFPDSVVVIVSGQEEPRFVKDAVNSGAAGFIPKSSTPEIMVQALKLVLAGGVYLPPMSLDLISDESAFSGNRIEPAAKHKLAGLSDRQSEALNLAVKGLSNKAIARDLGVSEGTIKQHLGVAFQVLGVSNRTEAVYALAASKEALIEKK
jgi:DNA-binding NarL/FixJ family response regulator